MLSCSDGSYYVGSTKNLEMRLAQHQTGEGAAYTRRRRPVKLVWFEEFSRVDQAFAREKQVQGWGRAKRDALISGRYNDLPALSVSRSSQSRRQVSTSSTTGAAGSRQARPPRLQGPRSRQARPPGP
ncbi:GIY-YIG nuclease family protein [Pseudarthrobacter sp. J47]|nr:GIY-YIG nuclease family protein [Pseudarthrobacter sp. J47]MEE2522287.1 GIY-YIG nuclease family protein [Pseudarthrobacter sp. J47]